jgi:hypothetical protein
MNSQSKETSAAPAVRSPEDLARDIEQLSELATLVASARDAMSDEIVTRLSSAVSEGITLLDRLTRNKGLMRLLQVLDRPESQYLLMSMADAIGKMSRDLATCPPARGGLVGLLLIAREPGVQEGLRALSLLGRYWNQSLRELHRRGG